MDHGVHFRHDDDRWALRGARRRRDERRNERCGDEDRRASPRRVQGPPPGREGPNASSAPGGPEASNARPAAGSRVPEARIRRQLGPARTLLGRRAWTPPPIRDGCGAGTCAGFATRRDRLSHPRRPGDERRARSGRTYHRHERRAARAPRASRSAKRSSGCWRWVSSATPSGASSKRSRTPIGKAGRRRRRPPRGLRRKRCRTDPLPSTH